MWKLIATLSWLDIKLRYRGSILGPFWVTMSTGVMVAALGLVYSTLFDQDMHDYLPYLSLSLVFWTAMSLVVTDACTTFTQAEGMIRSMRMPFSVHIWRVMTRNFLLLLHNLIIVVLVFAIYDTWPGWNALWAIPGLLVWLVDGVAACMLLGAICARFRDIPQIVGSIMQIAFYATPIVWKVDQIREGARFMPLNPVYVILEIVRGPLYGTPPSGVVWTSALVFSVALVIVAWLMFARVRGRLAFWV
ncbi:ABC transporter permease [Acidisphaera sp. L21]|uniref:ABC transporter permease n=1 Tax=Acidisphaera sp. L21 TaxID=1641851 RepID=UPI00131D56AC|nr:ABC transporter permease [Acidisphaera sp. L21]